MHQSLLSGYTQSLCTSYGLGLRHCHASNVAMTISMPVTGARDGALMVWDARCQAQICQRTGISFQGPVLIVPVLHSSAHSLLSSSRSVAIAYLVGGLIRLPEGHNLIVPVLYSLMHPAFVGNASAHLPFSQAQKPKRWHLFPGPCLYCTRLMQLSLPCYDVTD